MAERPIHELSDEEFEALLASENLDQLKSCREQLQSDIEQFNSKHATLHAASSLLDEKMAQERARAASQQPVAAPATLSIPPEAPERTVARPESSVQRLVARVLDKLKSFFRIPEQVQASTETVQQRPVQIPNAELEQGVSESVKTEKEDTEFFANLEREIAEKDAELHAHLKAELAKQAAEGKDNSRLAVIPCLHGPGFLVVDKQFVFSPEGPFEDEAEAREFIEKSAIANSYDDLVAGQNQGRIENYAADIQIKDDLTAAAIDTAESDLTRNLNQSSGGVVDPRNVGQRLAEIQRQHQQIRRRIEVLHRRLEAINDRIEQLEINREKIEAPSESIGVDREDADAVEEIPGNIVRMEPETESSSERITS